MSARTGDWMQTYTGRRFWPIDPRADEIDIEDIAHALAMQCRYGGHGLRFYSVAEHCVLMAEHLAEFGADVALWALLHDASEAYVVDVPRPLKPYLVNYKHFETQVMRAVIERFDMLPEMPSVVHVADNRIIADERVQNLVAIPWDVEPGPPLGVTLEFWAPEDAKRIFLSLFASLMRRRDGAA